LSTVEAAPQLLHEFFVRAARRWPDRTAVEVPPGPYRPARRRTTYAELDRQSDALSGLLKASVSGECVVAILLPRTSAHLYIAQIAVLKAGAAYACIEPNFPDERLRDILADARPALLLTDPAGRARAIAAGFNADRILDVVQHAAPARTPFGSPKPAWLTPSHLAYVIYTSGTTGRPKGVMIEHRSIANLVASDIDAFRLHPDDRVAQGSSAAYDSSVEETWLAFASGAAVVLMDDDAARLGPDLARWLERERITVFCPPPTLLRAMGVNDPAQELPGIHLLYVGGEALPPDIADRWARGRSLVNGYGPTECTVTALRARIAEGQNVTIGRPVPGVHAWVLDDALEVVPDGGKGELCLGGIALARGYWNQPELTASRFPLHPELGRLYRTGDLVHKGEDGSFIYYGRLDAQVKLRGYRVELGAIESALAGCSGVRAAACTVQEEGGRQTLVAFVVPLDAASPPSSAALRDALRARLPDYMVPARVGSIAALPTTTGGKLDRNALPRLDRVNGGDDRRDNGATGGNGAHERRAAPRDAREALVEAAVRTVLRRAEAVGVNDDFFTALGGDSLSAAELITLLREEPATASLAVRDVYEARTVAALAARASGGVPAQATLDEPDRAPARVVLATLVQAAWLARGLLISSALAYVAVFHLLPYLASVLGATRLILLSPLLLALALALYVPLSVAMVVGLKRALIGRYRPLRANAWSGFYVRNWMVQQAAKGVPWWLIEGTELQCVILRALGARIGSRVHLHRGVRLRLGGWDLLDIGDDVTVSQDVSLGLVELVDGDIVVAGVRIGDGATLEVHAGLAGGTEVGPGACLAPRAALARGGRIPAGERWDGIPAQPAGASDAPPQLSVSEPELSPAAAGALLILAKLGLGVFLGLPVAALAVFALLEDGVDAPSALHWLYSPSLGVEALLVWVLFAMVSVPITLVMEALACRFMGRVPEGVVSRWSPAYVRIWLKPGMVDSAGRWLYGTLMWPWWLRLAGMKVGAECEISGLIDTLPECVEIGAKTFCADGIYMAGPRVHRGTVSIGRVTLGENTFFGNGVVIAGGQHLPNDVLLGVCTVADDRIMRAGTAWFGHPPLELPHREVIAYDPRFTWDPSRARVMARVFWELARFAVPVAPAFVVALWFKWLIVEGTHGWAELLLLLVPLITVGAAAFHMLLIIAIKWTLLGRVKPGVRPLWSSWASRWDLVCVAWNIFASDVVSALDGTLLLHPLLRIMGVHVGRGVLLGPAFAEDLPDPDMLTLEDGATADCLIQAHTFEDRVLKIDRVRIRRGATVGRNAVLLYGADVGERARVAPHSVVMKHEHLLPGRSYAGFPTRPEDRASS
jgi:non-ribosomal peptide synthetase-like protein